VRGQQFAKHHELQLWKHAGEDTVMIRTNRTEEVFAHQIEDVYELEGDDTDIYDENNEVTDPTNPIWDGSDVHISPYGTDPTLPDPNEVNPD
jgi:hypothetical protein